MVIDNVVDNLPFIVRRAHRIVAAFAKNMHAEDWARDLGGVKTTCS